jgi:hypothetical protein
MKAIRLPEFIHTFVDGRQYLIRTTSPHFVAEVVSYHDKEEMHRAVALLHQEHIPYVTFNKKAVAVIFRGAMGRVPLIPTLQQQIRETTAAMAEYYLKSDI